MVELRKRKTPPPAPSRPEKKKSVSKEGSKQAKDESKPVQHPAEGNSDPAVGKSIELDGFGGDVETNDGVQTSLKELVDKSRSGVVLFTYPKASTPGCTTQGCLFRDAYTPLTATGLSIFGLSMDSPKANTSFKTKHSFPYDLLCDSDGSLVKAIGMSKIPKGTKRGVFVVSKTGEVLACESGGPQATVDVVRRIVDKMSGSEANSHASKAQDKKVADVAGEVADTAAKLDK